MARTLLALVLLTPLAGCAGTGAGALSAQRPLQTAVNRLHAQPYASRYAYQTTTPAGGPLPARAAELLDSRVEETSEHESQDRIRITEIVPDRAELLFYDGDTYVRSGSGPSRRVAPATAARYRAFYLQDHTPGRNCAVTRIADYTGPGGQRQLRYRVRVTGGCLRDLFSRVFARATARGAKVQLSGVALDYFVDAQSGLLTAASGRITGSLQLADRPEAVPFMRVSRQGYFSQPVHLRRPSG